jgi:glucosamine kinase
MAKSNETERPGASFFIGVDAGASRCRARLRDSAGVTRAETELGAANVYVDFDHGVAVMRAAVVDVLARAGLDASETPRVAIGFGVAGLSKPDDIARLVAAFPGYSGVVAVNDAVAACVGAHEGADGGLVIAGTGSAAIARVGGRQTIIGGHGFLLGDDGSGARIGADAARAALRALDQVGPASPLTAAMLDRFGHDAEAMTGWALGAKPHDYGAFAPDVFAFAREGDPIAERIVETAARAIAALIRRVAALGASRVALVGGIGESLRPYFEPAVAALVADPLRDAMDGAILIAGGALARLDGPAS